MKVRRWTRTSLIFTTAAAVLVVALGAVPFNFGGDVMQNLTSLFILIILATMWNALAGFGGLVSVGQQAFIGVGAYATLYFAGQGIPPYVAMVVAALFSGLLALVLSVFALRLRGAQFAIGMWVIAEILRILVTLNASLGGGTGLSLIQLNQYDPLYQQAFTMWIALGFAVVTITALFILLRSRMGTSIQAIRDDEEAAQSLGVRVGVTKRALFVLAGAGCGAAGTLIIANSHFVNPGSIFSVQWTALMIFMVLVGGLGSFEGPFIGAILLYAIEQIFSAGGAWYLVGLGATAAAFAVFLPAGIWGTLQQRLGIQLLPVGYYVEAIKPAKEASAA